MKTDFQQTLTKRRLWNIWQITKRFLKLGSGKQEDKKKTDLFHTKIKSLQLSAVIKSNFFFFGNDDLKEFCEL